MGLDCPSPSFSSGKLKKYFLTLLVCREDTIISDYNASVAEGCINKKISISLVDIADDTKPCWFRLFGRITT